MDKKELRGEVNGREVKGLGGGRKKVKKKVKEGKGERRGRREEELDLEKRSKERRGKRRKGGGLGGCKGEGGRGRK
jgi:hypothetical protein